MKGRLFLSFSIIFILSTLVVAIRYIFLLAIPIGSPKAIHIDTKNSAWFVLGQPIEVKEVSKADFQNISTEYYRVYLYSHGVKRKVVYQGEEVSDLQISPSQKKLSFYYYPEGNSLSDISLVVLDTSENSIKEVYRKSIRTSNYKWKNDETLAVNYSCGTACMYRYTVDANTGNVLDEFHIY